MKPSQAKGVEESLQWVGQVLDLLVRPHPDIDGEYQIIDGEHRFNVIGDTVYCTIIHGLSEAEAKKLTIVMNETRGEADKIELAQLLKDIWADMGDDTGWALPYDETELTELVNLADVDWGNFEDAFEPEPENNSSGNSDGFTRFMVAIPDEAMDVINQARALVEDQRALHKDKDLAWGQVFESIAADFLATPRG